jgi:hypothetical protein
MKRSDINPMPGYYDRYINLAPDVELSQAFNDSIRQLNELDRTALGRIADKSYAPGKWTIKDIIQHLTDGERIMTYRALMFARRDPTAPGFDQNLFAENASANRRTFDDLLDELISVRRATKALYDSFEVSVLDLAFIILGHQIHHMNVIAERYSSF